MTAPGDNLEFLASEDYRKRTKGAEEIDDTVRAFLKNHPNAGAGIHTDFPYVKELVIVVNGMPYIVFFHRKPNKIGFINIYDVDDIQQIETKRQQLIAAYRKS